MRDGLHRIYAIVVTYEPDVQIFREVIKRISSQVDATVVVDNSENTDVVGVVGNAFGSDVKVLSMEGNKGIGSAHNKGIDYAVDAGATHIILLDQDSLAEKGMAAALLKVLEQKNCIGEKVSATGARYREVGSGRYSTFVRFGWLKFRQIPCPRNGRENVIRADFLISSGSMISVQTLSDVGKMDASLFIDHVDTEWFLRARSKGYTAYGVCNAIMSHKLGEGSFRIWIGRWRGLPRHTPIRYYYIVRNSILLYKRRYAPIRWIMGDLVRLVVILIFYTALQAPRWRRLKMIGKGLIDGLIGRGGQYMVQD